MWYPPFLPFLWAYKGSAHLWHQPKPTLNVIYKKHSAPTSSFPWKAPFSHSPWDSQKCDTLPLFQRVKWLLLKLMPTLLPCGLADRKGCEQVGLHASSPLPHPLLRVQEQTPSVVALAQSLSCAARTKEISKPRSSPQAAPSTACQATGPADNQALQSPMCFVTLIFKDTLA